MGTLEQKTKQKSKLISSDLSSQNIHYISKLSFEQSSTIVRLCMFEFD